MGCIALLNINCDGSASTCYEVGICIFPHKNMLINLIGINSALQLSASVAKRHRWLILIIYMFTDYIKSMTPDVCIVYSNQNLGEILIKLKIAKTLTF